MKPKKKKRTRITKSLKPKTIKKMNKKIIVSGGGTGGHIFPAIAIANALKEIDPKTEILFVGALHRMEMEKVPAAGYPIIGLPVAGFQRRLTWKNLTFFVKLFRSMQKARSVIKDFAPDAVVGVGGYASGPMLRSAARKGIPTLIQEQNSYAGVTNKLLAQKAKKICVAYSGMEKYFPAEKIILTGNPVRQGLEKTAQLRDEALKYFKLDSQKTTILLIGGSLGARTLNQSVTQSIDKLGNSNIQFIWQTGKTYNAEAKALLKDGKYQNIWQSDFISRMDLAYAVADVVISRAGAISISELCLVGKPAILVPSPNVAEDHQTHNAMALANQQAAIMIRDADAQAQLIDEALNLANNTERKALLSSNIQKLAHPDAAKVIALEVMKLIDHKNSK
jgi:UDP-N-acetylglucosamine--N-acetylmuramyl-(pentapeptide) pyrophosphoryl-undecaprenol N-acetylglucosamine transferase